MADVAIGILCYNEEKNLSKILDRLIECRSDYPEIDLKLKVINNGSSDNTDAVIGNYELLHPFISHLNIEVNHGYGFGIRAGLSSLNGEIVGFMWGDNQFDAEVIFKLCTEMMQNEDCQMAKTYRIKRYDGRMRLVTSKIYELIFNILYNNNIRDVNSGPKLFRRGYLEKILPLTSNDWFIDAEIMIKTLKISSPILIREIPIEFYPRESGKSNVKFSSCFQFLKNLVKYKIFNR